MNMSFLKYMMEFWGKMVYASGMQGMRGLASKILKLVLKNPQSSLRGHQRVSTPGNIVSCLHVCLPD